MAFAADWVFLPICLFPLALAGVVFGLRGRRLDDHPFCRGCGLDLAGEGVRPAGTARPVSWAHPGRAGACPGCGADLKRRRAVGVGRRQRRRGLVAAALPVLLLCLGWFVPASWYAIETCDWQSHKPTWWLLGETASRDANRRDAAVRELTDRLGRGKLTRPQTDELTRRALDYQAESIKPWSGVWGEWIERAHDAGLLADAQWRRYASQAVCFRLEVRPDVRRGDPLVLRLSVAPARVAKGRRFSLDAGFAGDAWVNGQRVTGSAGDPRIIAPGGVRADAGSVATAAGASGETGASGDAGAADEGLPSRLVCYDLKPPLLARLADGGQTCRVSFDALIGERPDSVDPPLAEAHVALEAPWRLLPEAEPSVKLLRGTAAVPLGRLAVSAGCRWADDARRRMAVNVFCQDLPVALACEVFVHTAAGEWPAGTLAWAKGSTGASVIVESGPLPPEAAKLEKVDVVLRPSAAVAARTVDLSEIWGEPIVVPDVEVVWNSAPREQN